MTARTPARPTRGLLAACVGNGVEWYDFAVYGAMASVTAVVLLPPGDDAQRLVTVFAVSATSFVARPLGALLVGRAADRTGRHGALVATVLMMSAATAAIGLLPTWQALGLAVPLCLLALRLTQGFASGGEISSSIPFLLEHAPARRWGFYSGWHTATVALGLACGIGVAGLLSALLSTSSLETWGWRLPFLLALPLGAAGLYLRLRVGETPAFVAETRRASGTPVLRTVWREHGRTVKTGFVLVCTLTGTFNIWFVFLPSHLATQGAYRLPVALGCAALGLLAAAGAAPLWGRLSDRIGRRPLLLTGTAAVCVLAAPLYLVAMRGEWPGLLVADVLVGVVLGMLVISAHLAERFPVAVRARGVALTYGLATALVGGTAPLLGSLLVQWGWPTGVPAYVALLGAAGVLACLRAPGERHIGVDAPAGAGSASGTHNG